jgi:predicted regulator of Ras-like GTPase activity (Roadblock/LC7/MglB family)
VDVASALADLTEISSQIEAAVVLDAKGAVLASTLAEPETDRLARAAVGLYEAATAQFRSTGRTVTQLEAALRGGSVFVVREGDVGIAARTSPGPSSGLVFYDLRTCLRAVAEAQQRKPKPRRRAAKKKTETTDA